tara:strand:+ start:368 stop:499 length:132 start_codon:yes stop_codon:yes gene_type:complete
MYSNNKRIIPRKIGKPNKYFAKKTVAMGLKFDSLGGKQSVGVS